MFEVPKSTVGDMYGKDNKKSENFVSQSECPTKVKKKSIVRKAKFEELEKACYCGFLNSALRVLQCQDLY